MHLYALIKYLYVIFYIAIMYKPFKSCMLNHFCLIINFVLKCTEINLEFLYRVPNGKKCAHYFITYVHNKLLDIYNLLSIPHY